MIIMMLLLLLLLMIVIVIIIIIVIIILVAIKIISETIIMSTKLGKNSLHYKLGTHKWFKLQLLRPPPPLPLPNQLNK